MPGHEIAGVIEEFGNCSNPDEFGLKLGDFVLLYPWVGCGHCEVCLIGCTNECTNNPKMINNYGFSPNNAGGYSSQILAHTLQILVKVPNSIPKDVAAMLPCSGLTAYTSLKKAVQFLQEGYSRNKCAKLLVAGSGGLGLWCIQLANLMFSHLNIEVTVADVSQDKLLKNVAAKERGAKTAILWQITFENVDEQLSEVQKQPKEANTNLMQQLTLLVHPIH